MSHALIENGVVVQIDLTGEPPEGFVEVAAHVQPGYTFEDGVFSPPAPSAPSLDAYEDAIQAVVDATAKEKLFRDGVTLASYVNSTDPQWAAEAVAFVAWRDGVWRYAYAELAKVQGGHRPQPSVEDFLSEIEPINWPEPAPA